MLGCVVNISEGRQERILQALAGVVESCLLDVHRDPDHHRSVFTLAGQDQAIEKAVRGLAAAAVSLLDVTTHQGAHPRFGVVDVVPFIPLGETLPIRDIRDLSAAVEARNRFAAWAGRTLKVPSYLYGPMLDGSDRTLPMLRRALATAMLSTGHPAELEPDFGPHKPHPSAGVVAVGARRILVAYNLWLDGADLVLARAVARAIRGPRLRALGIPVANSVQVSCNLIDPWSLGPAQAYEAVQAQLRSTQAGIARAELVGLLPEGVLRAVPKPRWPSLDLSEQSTIEARIRERNPG